MDTSNTANTASLKQLPTRKVNIQVVLEYQWTNSPDLISNVEVDQVVRENPEISPQQLEDITLQSVIDSLTAKGFGVEAEQRISFRDKQKGFNVYIGQAADKALIDSYRLPKEAFTATTEGPWELTLFIREAGTGLSAKKPVVLQQTVSFGQDTKKDDEMTRKRLFDQVDSAVPSSGLAESSQFAKQSHTLLASQSFEMTHNKPVTVHNIEEVSGSSEKLLQRGSTMEVGTPSKALLDQADLKRTKERQIRFVVERVSLWRKLYNGVELGNGETVRYSLEDSAKLVGISKKSLDDYLLQLRFGRMYGFDFLKHQCDNIGVLRKFVRERKARMQRQQQRQIKDQNQTTDLLQVPSPEAGDRAMADETSHEESSQSGAVSS